MLLTLFVAIATAGPLACESLDESAFIDLVLQGQAAVDAGDAETHESRVAELQARIPCLAFAPRSRLLSEYYVLEALVRFAEGGDWQSALDAALLLRPGADRGVGDAHPMARHPAPEAPPASGIPVPPGRVVYVDGSRALELPSDRGLHLVQVTQGELWRSVRVDAAHPLPEGWFDEPFQVPRVWLWWGHAGVALGPGGTTQKRADGWAFEEGQTPWAPNAAWTTVWPAVVARGAVANGGVGLAAELEFAFAGFSKPVGEHAQVALVAGRSVFAGVGVGLGGNTRIEGDPTQPAPAQVRLTSALPYGYATALAVASRWDGGLSVGVGPSTARASLYAGLAADAPAGATPVRFGLSGSLSQGRYAQAGDDGPAPGRDLDALSWRFGLEVGIRRPTR